MKTKEKLDPTDMSAHSRAQVHSVSDVLDIARIRAKGYDNMDVDRVSDLKIEWMDANGQDRRDSGWYAKIGNRHMMLSNQAVRGASHMIGQRDPKHWKMYPDRNAFPTALAHILDNKATSGNRVNPKRLLVRHDGLKVRAILPFTYKIRDAYELLETFVDHIERNIAPVQGISTIEDGDPGDILSYRLILPHNIMPKLGEDFGQMMMYLLATSETGAGFFSGNDTVTSLGLFRHICTNSAVRAGTFSKWNHRSLTQEKFFGDSIERIQQMGYYQDKYAQIFDQLLNTKLESTSPRDFLRALHTERLITSGHYDSAELYVQEKTEDGRDVSNQYDMFNVLTRAAHDLPSLVARQQAETRTLHLFTEKGGVFERLRQAAMDRARGSALRRGNSLEEQPQ